MDEERFTFIEVNKVSCRVMENGYWVAETENAWVKRKSLAKCIDVLMSKASWLEKIRTATELEKKKRLKPRE